MTACEMIARTVECALLLGAASILVVWGAMHLVPTTKIADSFGSLSLDNRRVLVMEWIAEGLAHISFGLLVACVTLFTNPDDTAAAVVYRVVAAIEIVLAVLTLATGARTPVIWFKICPVVLTVSAALLVIGSFV